jgi:hypothetical protein
MGFINFDVLISYIFSFIHEKDWKNALDDNTFIAAILMDLSKAFDCLPHNLLMLKLEAYGLLENSFKYK